MCAYVTEVQCYNPYGLCMGDIQDNAGIMPGKLVLAIYFLQENWASELHGHLSKLIM